MQCGQACTSSTPHLLFSVAFQWFLTAFSERPGMARAISLQRLPTLRCASASCISSSSVQGSCRGGGGNQGAVGRCMRRYGEQGNSRQTGGGCMAERLCAFLKPAGRGERSGARAHTFLMSGMRWWFQRSRHCLPMRPDASSLPISVLSARAMGLQWPTPISCTSLVGGEEKRVGAAGPIGHARPR